MIYLDKKIFLLTYLLIGLFAWSDITKLQVPEGFEIQDFVTEIDDARQMVEGSNFIFVGTKNAGYVYAIDKNNANKVSVILTELDMPTGVALKNGDLYIAETDTIHVVKNIEDNQIVMGYPAIPFKDFVKKNKKNNG